MAMNVDENRSFGVFKPVGHLVVALPSGQQAAQAQCAVADLGVPDEAVHRLTDVQMLEQIEHDLRHASPLAALGQELNLIKAHREMAWRGHHWLVIRVADDAQAERIADTVRQWGAATAQLYGAFIIQELITAPDGTPQVSESPDRGLDAPTPAGKPAEPRQ
jgi:hypothetical protein